MAEAVNLDALIVREDFLVTESGVQVGSSGKSDASRTDLVKGESFYQTLRKPDFQRETAAWSPEAICEFVGAFIDGDLIPSVILWQSPSRLSFVIDGAHRLSAIIAWLLDDYGDGVDSKKFYNYNIPDKQLKIAEKTRELIKKKIGTHEQLKAETSSPGSYPELATKARALAHSKVPLLWVNTQDPKKAERAFFTINQSAVQIDPTELKILNSRFKPNAIAARAVVRNATGHKYWEKFSADGQKEIESIAKNIYALLYNPPLSSPIRTNELPIAGHGYGSQTLPLILDLVNIANGIAVSDPSKDKNRQTLSNEPENVNESETVKVIRGANKLAQVLTGTSAASLGLYPAVYFYSANGRHQPTTILAISDLLSCLIEKNKLNEFCTVRERFEEFLIEYKTHINQLTSQYGSMAKGFRQIKEYYSYILEQFVAGKTSQEIEDALKEHDKYHRLSKERVIKTTKAKQFSPDLKQLVLIRDVLSNAKKCEVCGARVDHKAMQMDHREDRKHGGAATSDNARWIHPYCNSTYKEFQRKKSEAA